MRPSFFIHFLFILHCPSGFIEGREKKNVPKYVHGYVFMISCIFGIITHFDVTWLQERYTLASCYNLILSCPHFLHGSISNCISNCECSKVVWQQNPWSQVDICYQIIWSFTFYTILKCSYLTLLSFTPHKPMWKSPIFPWT